MKYIVLLADGMADCPHPMLGNKTPLEVANVPYFDKMANEGEFGMVKTVPEGYPPGSDVANLSVMGYAPSAYYTGRSPLEAVSMGVEMEPTDYSFRTNLVTLSDAPKFEDKIMVDYSSDEITTAESHQLIKALSEQLGSDILKFYGGISYRHLLIWKELKEEFNLTPPHDISKKVIEEYLPNSRILLDLMKKSNEILSNHPVNIARVNRGLHPANTAWFWGQGKKPQLTSFEEKFGLKGGVISAVDLVKGIGKCADMAVFEVEGATGNIDTNFEGKAKMALKALKTLDFVYIHIEAPDECGHQFDVQNKVKSLELINDKVLTPIIDTLTAEGTDFKLLLMPDHPTPLNIGTHTSNPVPYAIYDSRNIRNNNLTYTEKNAENREFVQIGDTLMGKFVG